MIIMNLKLDNIISFKKFEINFSYPKKVKNNLLNNEYMSFNNAFRYKKLNIFIGSNASGKTSLIRTIWQILVFLQYKERASLDKIINYLYPESSIEIDFVYEENRENYLYRFSIITDNHEKTIKISRKKVKLSSNSTYENTISRFDTIDTIYKDYIEVLNECDFEMGWYTALPSTEEQFDKINFIETKNENEEKEYLNILTSVLKTLDSSIKNVRKSLDAENAYVIEHESNPALIIQSGMDLARVHLLSSGTKYGINMANIIYSIKKHQNGIYLIDEQFSYVNSDIEVSMLATMASMLEDGEQLFFTTHNTNILSLSFPIHSFYFLNKNKTNNNKIEVVCASSYENRNNISVKNLYDNDLFNTAPDTAMIFELGANNEGK